MAGMKLKELHEWVSDLMARGWGDDDVYVYLAASSLPAEVAKALENIGFVLSAVEWSDDGMIFLCGEREPDGGR
jgi:hypothetical protein